MKRKAVIVAIGLALVFVLAGCGGNDSSESAEAVSVDSSLSGPSADWKTNYETMEKMATETDLIITGKVTGHSQELRHDVVFTKQTIEVLSAIKPNSENTPKEITVLQTGGSKDGVETEPFPEAPLLEEGKTYLLFLEHSDEGHYLIGGGYQGVAEVTDDKVTFTCDFTGMADKLEATPAGSIEKEIAKLIETE